MDSTISLITMFVYTFVKFTPSSSVCETGWFGSSCQYKCHCANDQCDVDGKCTGGSTCDMGWFGLLCQYQDLTTVQPGTTTSNSILTDGDDATCDSVQTFTVSWNNSYVVTWLRVVFEEPDLTRTSEVTFIKTDGSRVNCIDEQVIIFTLKVTDIHCSTNTLNSEILINLKSNKSVCSVYISGGRNVALKQATLLSSTYSSQGINYVASKAVDGNRSGNLTADKSCTHTLNGLPGSFKVTFSQPWYLNRYVLYNRLQNRERLKGFILRSYSSNNDLQFSYTDTNPSPDVPVYHVTTRPAVNPISYVTVNTIGILSLCEVETYSDQRCTAKMYGLECSSPCNCDKTEEKCIEATGACPSGCPAGFESYGCSKVCTHSHYGPKCAEMCTNCLNQQCNNVDGSCPSCAPGYKGSACKETCDATYYGPDCAQRCSENCKEQLCSNVDGSCINCPIGTEGMFCETNCRPTMYGDRCSEPCSTGCINSLCDRTNGRCLRCSVGKSGFFCDQDCAEGFFGVNCASICSDYCLSLQCNSTTGYCFKCKVGYKGTFCDQVCDNGYYGDGCNTSCSTLCVVNEKETICNNTNGECLIEAPQTRGQLLKEDSSSTTTSILIIVGVLAFIAVVIAAILLRPKNQRLKGNIDVISEQSICDRRKNRNNSCANVKEVLVSELHDSMQTDGRKFYFEEFNKISSSQTESRFLGQRVAKKRNNRCKSIRTHHFPPVHHKINTKDIIDDYINATEGYKDEDKFIALQGPNESSVIDFVRMLWEQKVDKVVMLHYRIAERKEKCSRYWPTEGSTKFGDIKVKVTTKHVFADYTLRKLELSKKDQPTHHFTQFHFTSWPDKGVPLTPWGLVDFEQRVALGSTSRPIVVHCSGKVDWKGIFIALYNVIREAEDAGRIHVLHEGVLLTLTAEQYRCLYKVLERQNEVNSHFANLSRAKRNNYVMPPTEEEENVYANS